MSLPQVHMHQAAAGDPVDLQLLTQLEALARTRLASPTATPGGHAR